MIALSRALGLHPLVDIALTNERRVWQYRARRAASSIE